MAQNTLLPKGVKPLLVATIFILALVRGELGQRILIALVAVYVALGALWLFQYLKQSRQRRPKPRQAIPTPLPTTAPPESQTQVQQPGPPPESPPKVIVMADEKTPITAALQHTNCRISDKLRSVFPDATWDWVSEEPESIALHGGEGRIRLSGVEEFNYADVKIDALLKITFKLLKIVTLDEAEASLSSKEEPPIPAKPDMPMEVSDVAAWFDMIGQSQIDALLTEVNSRGHRLFIEENGDVYITENGAPSKQGVIHQMPAAKHWRQLVELLTADGDLEVKVGGKDAQQLCICWANN